jgi:uncharacterized membrane protein (DUF485 family)
MSDSIHDGRPDELPDELHGELHPDLHPQTISRNARYGLLLFVLYVLLYGGFMALSAFAPDVMQRTAINGVNVAILYGMGLILAALFLALVYMVLCERAASRR